MEQLLSMPIWVHVLLNTIILGIVITWEVYRSYKRYQEKLKQDKILEDYRKISRQYMELIMWLRGYLSEASFQDIQKEMQKNLQQDSIDRVKNGEKIDK